MGYLNYLRTLLFLLLVDLTAGNALAEARFEIQPYEATYEVYRKGKLTGELNSQLKKIGAHKYQLSDITKGTSGLASLVNFERSEITTFEFKKQQPEVITHTENQKITFKSRFYEFNHKPGSDKYQGIYKDKPFTVNSNQKLLTSHLLPWQLAQQVCRHKNKFSLPLLKSNEARIYHFETQAFDNSKTLVDRIYDGSKKRRTTTWINHENGCYVSEINHYDDEEHIRTVLTNIEFTKP